MMDAEAAARTWFVRAAEILEAYAAKGPTAPLWQESALAGQGASLLLQNRYAELSALTADKLRQMVDVMAEVNRNCLDSAKESVLSEAASEFYYAIRGELLAGAYAVERAAKTAVAGVTFLLVLILAIVIAK